MLEEAEAFIVSGAIEVYCASRKHWISSVVVETLPHGSLHVDCGAFRKIIPRSQCTSSTIRKVQPVASREGVARPLQDPSRRRSIYISMSSLMRRWDSEGEALLKNIPEHALFFFGSKRRWVFAETREEINESQRENPKYTSPKYQALRDFIKEREDRTPSEVCWLKPPDFQYNGDLYHGPGSGAFQRASEWLQQLEDPSTGKNFEALKLDPKWWETTFIPSKAMYTRHVKLIVKNFTNGAHDYDPVMELLYQSNPTLHIEL